LMSVGTSLDGSAGGGGGSGTKTGSGAGRCGGGSIPACSTGSSYGMSDTPVAMRPEPTANATHHHLFFRMIEMNDRVAFACSYEL
jgi:hypothetical protein